MKLYLQPGDSSLRRRALLRCRPCRTLRGHKPIRHGRRSHEPVQLSMLFEEFTQAMPRQRSASAAPALVARPSTTSNGAFLGTTSSERDKARACPSRRRFLTNKTVALPVVGPPLFLCRLSPKLPIDVRAGV